jgi:AAA+ ATPase superfamily predicted ATPase
MNPFLLKSYKSAEYFCDRRLETDKLICAINNNQDITLFAYRRLGKSALIHHVFNKIKNDYICVYIDIWGTSNIDEFTKEFANSIIQSTLFSKRSIKGKLSNFLKSIGASFSFDMDGKPKVDFMYHDNKHSFHGIEEIFSFLHQSKIPIVIAIDEFQEIKKYDSATPFEGKLRALIQQTANINFIFSGSEQHLINEIFNTYSKPFYQSTRMLTIDKIDKTEYHEFILSHFKKGNKDINPEIISHILDITHVHTYYVQAVANFLYSQTVLPTNIYEFEILYKDYILEKSVFYRELPDRLTKQQFAAVKSFAKQGKVTSPTSASFMEKTSIKSTSSMQRALNSLLEKQIVIKDKDAYRLYDVFLEHYLKYFK